MVYLDRRYIREISCDIAIEYGVDEQEIIDAIDRHSFDGYITNEELTEICSQLEIEHNNI